MADADVKNYQIYFERPRFKSVSIYKMELDGNRTIGDLKEDLHEKFQTPADRQIWLFTSTELENSSSLNGSDVPEGGTIMVKVQGQASRE